MRIVFPFLLICALAKADPFAQDLEARRARFFKEGARPQAALPLIGLFELWDKLSDRAPLVRFLDDAIASHAQPEVKARALYLRAP
jgi:hypothetical protein